jgi:uncharacterized membrane protein
MEQNGLSGPAAGPARWRGLWLGICVGTAVTSIVALLQAHYIAGLAGYDLQQIPSSEVFWYPVDVVKSMLQGLAVLWAILFVCFVVWVIVTRARRASRARG